MWETWVRALGWEDPLEKRKATHSSILAWRIPWITIHGVTKCQSDTTEGLSLSVSFFSSQSGSPWNIGLPQLLKEPQLLLFSFFLTRSSHAALLTYLLDFLYWMLAILKAQLWILFSLHSFFSPKSISAAHSFGNSNYTPMISTYLLLTQTVHLCLIILYPPNCILY